jgi:hypothetical protein
VSRGLAWVGLEVVDAGGPAPADAGAREPAPSDTARAGPSRAP